MLFLNIKSVLFNILFQTLLNEGRQMQALRKKKKKENFHKWILLSLQNGIKSRHAPWLNNLIFLGPM